MEEVELEDTEVLEATYSHLSNYLFIYSIFIKYNQKHI